MEINVLYFGIVRERLGCGEETMVLPDGARVADLLTILEGRHGSLEKGVDSLRIAVNREYVDSDFPLANNDEVAVIPPVSGGSRVRDF
jgi:molybdopterin converting factor subunit 1